MLGRFSFVRTDRPDRGQFETEYTNLKDKFYPSPFTFFKVARTIFGVILQHHPFKMTHSIYTRGGLTGQLWQMESVVIENKY